MGHEPTPELYIERMVELFREVRRVLKPHGTLWLNMGDSYLGSWGSQGRSEVSAHVTSNMAQRQIAQSARNFSGASCPQGGLKPKDMVGMPWRLALALRDDGWYLRQDIIWAKPNPMPESVTDRFTKSHEYIFLLSKSRRYFFDQFAVREPLADDTVARYRRGRGTDHKHAASSQTIARSFQHMLPTMEEQPHAQVRRALVEELELEQTARPVNVPSGWNVEHEESNLLGRYRRDAPHRASSARSSEEFRGVKRRNQDLERLGTSRGNHNPSCTHPDGRNKRSVLWIPSLATPEAHFATFPIEIAELAMLAGTSQHGVCRECGRPFERVERRSFVRQPDCGPAAAICKAGDARNRRSGSVRGRTERYPEGWRSTCSCGAPAEPALVLDPFAGAATVGLAGLKHGRRFLGIELSTDYIEIAYGRARKFYPLLVDA